MGKTQLVRTMARSVEPDEVNHPICAIIDLVVFWATGTNYEVNNVSEAMQAEKRPYFMWDYPLDNAAIRDILQQGNPQKKSWIIRRILNYAKWNDIWDYLTVADIRDNFENLRFRHPHDRELWAYALDRWAAHE